MPTDASPAPAARLSLGTKLGFGVCDLGGNLFFTVLGFYALKYLTDTVGIAAAMAGVLLMVGKIVDAFWDPVLGFLSDHTRSRWGRRRPYLLFGSVPMALAMWWFFTNPRIADPAFAILWGLAAFILLNMSYSVVNIPYSSLTPELTTDYHERSTLNGYRFMFAVVGTLIGGVAVDPVIRLFGGGADKSLGFSMVGLLFGGLMLVTAMITGLAVREPPRARETKTEKGFVKTYLSVFANTAYLIVLIAYALYLIGLTFLQSAITYYFTYIYGNEGMQTLALGILLVVAMVFIPVSVIVSKRIGKKLSFQICLFILGTSSLALFFLGHVFGPGFFLGMMVYSGIGVGFGYVAPLRNGAGHHRGAGGPQREAQRGRILRHLAFHVQDRPGPRLAGNGPRAGPRPLRCQHCAGRVREAGNPFPRRSAAGGLPLRRPGPHPVLPAGREDLCVDHREEDGLMILTHTGVGTSTTAPVAWRPPVFGFTRKATRLLELWLAATRKLPVGSIAKLLGFLPCVGSCPT